MNLGIEKHSGMVLEGDNLAGIEINPPPVVSHCKIVAAGAHITEGPDSQEIFGVVFREDSFDSKSRIRRGRIYRAFGTQPQTWRLRSKDTPLESIATYSSFSLWAERLTLSPSNLNIILGDKTRFTVWRLIDVEVIFTGEELITLKAINTFGLLPNLIESTIPAEFLLDVKNRLMKVAENMYVSSSEAVVDSCREAASAAIGAALNAPGLDLGALLKSLDNDEMLKGFRILKNSTDTLARLHSRTKINEERKYGSRPVSDEDAQHAVSCLSQILIELGWAKW